METKTLKPEHYSLANFHKDRYCEHIFEKVDDFAIVLDDARQHHFELSHQNLMSETKPHVLIKNKYSGYPREMLMFGSNNYLGLSYRPEVIEAGIRAMEKYGNGTSGPPHFNGTTDLHRELEIKLARYKGYEDCLLFSSGYGANLGTVNALAGKANTVVIDKLNHASIIDGALQSKAEIIMYPHKNICVLEQKLNALSNPERCLLITDGVFSMEGDIAPLDEIFKLKEKYGFALMLDEAHATGVLGLKGKGTATYFGLSGKMDLEIGTMSKSMGGMGGFVVGNKKLIDYLRFFARSYLFSSALSPATVAGLIAAIDIMEDEGEVLSRKVQFNASYLRTTLIKKGFRVLGDSTIPIVPVVVGDDTLLFQVSKELNDRGIFTNAVLYPAVPKKECRLRISVMATHHLEDLDILIMELESLFKKYGLV